MVLSDVAKRSIDEGGQYFQVGKEFGRHETINHSADEYVRGDAHTNKIEGYFATLNRGIIASTITSASSTLSTLIAGARGRRKA